MDFLEFEEIDPWQTNLNKVTCNLKEGLDLTKLSTTGADFELLPNDDPNIEEEKAAEEYQQNLMENLNPECADFCDEEDGTDDNKSPFAKMAIGMEDLTGDGGILKKVLTHGIGPVVPEGALVRVHYNGYLEYCDEPYDSSRLRNKEQQFKLGRGDVLHGWEVGVATMKRKELARYLIGPSYAFGKFGCPPRIPPNATIMFEIEVINFVDLKVADDFGHYTKEEREKITLDQLVSVANAIREEGNDAFHYKSYGKACSKYMKAVRLLENRRLKNDEEEAKWKSLLVKLYLNVSLCNLRLRKPKVAISHSRNALSLDSKSVKAIFRLGQAHMQLSEFEQSRHYLLKAGKLSPGNVEIRQELEKLNRAVEKFKAVEKNICTKMFPSAQGEGGERASSSSKSRCDAELPKSKLEEYRKLYHDKFSQLSQNPDMLELMVPLPLPESERTCAEEVAKELDLLTEMVPDSGLKVYKMPIPEMEEFLENH